MHAHAASNRHSDFRPLQFPPVIGVEELAALLRKSVVTILNDRSRAPVKLPPECTPPGTKSPIWLLSDVLKWLADHRDNGREQRAIQKTVRCSQGRGRPTAVESAEAERLGVTVKELRQRRGHEAGDVL